MQEISSTLLSVVDNGINNNPNDRLFDWAVLIEIYDVDQVPPFNPANAIKRFSDIKITWNGYTYQRYVQNRGEIERSVGTDFNRVNITYSNIDRYIATLFNTDVLLEGQHFLIRLVSRSVTDSSIVLFTGRQDNPNDTGEEQLPVQYKQHGSVDYEVPKREFTEDDPEGRLPDDIDFQGFRFIPTVGGFDIVKTEIVPSTSFFGRLFGKTKRKTTIEHRQYSSQDGTPYGDPLREAFGQVQVDGIPINHVDTGTGLKGLYAWANGRIGQINDLKCRTQGLTQPFNITHHHGFLSSEVGDNATADPLFPNAGTFSKTAYSGLQVEGSSPEQEDSAPTITAVILGRVVAIWDASGNLLVIDWTDNPVWITRMILTHDDFIGLPQAFIDDLECARTARICDQPLLDVSNGDALLIPNDQAPNVGTTFNRFHSTSRLFPWYYYRRLNQYDDLALSVFLDQFTTFDPDEPPTLIAPVEVLRRRYTCNVTLTDRVKVVDFLFNTILPSFRGYLTIGSNGKIQIRTEQPADNSILTASTIAGATELPVYDVAPWAESLKGEVLMGTGLTTSEHRVVTGIKYSAAGNSIPISKTVSGSITATVSSATLAGGTDSIAPSATITVGGSIVANDQIVINIDGTESSLLVDASDSLGTIAGRLADTINAHTNLARYVEAIWDTASPAIVTIKSKLGSLVLESALDNAHTGTRANPTTAPTLAASSGLLGAGTYYVAYSYVTALGETNLSPAQSIVLAADEKIDVTTVTLPAGVTSINWYVSTVPNSTVLSYINNNDGSGFSINSLPLTTAKPAPSWNTTGEEVIRIAMAFDASNIVEKSFKWPLRGNSTSYNQFTMKFREAVRDFGEATFKLRSKPHIQRVRKVNNLDMDGSAVDNYHQAARLVRSKAAKELDGAPDIGKPTYFFQLSSRGRALLIEEGDVCCLSDDTGGTGDIRFINVPARVEKVTISNDLTVTLTLRAYSTNMFSDHVVPRNVVLPSSITPRTPDHRLVLTLTGGTYTLSSSEASYDIIEVQGVLTSNQIIIVPNINKQWTVINNTTGAFTLTIQTAGE